MRSRDQLRYRFVLSYLDRRTVRARRATNTAGDSLSKVIASASAREDGWLSTIYIAPSFCDRLARLI